MTILEKLEELIYRSSQDAAQRSQEIDRRFQETDRLFKERTRQYEIERKEMREQLYGLTKTLGLFAESMVHPSTIPLFTARGLVLTEVQARLSARRNGGTMEIDVLGAGPEAVVAIEAKSRLTTDGVKDFLKRLPHFFEYFPRYRGLKLYGAVAGLSVEASVARYACKQGLFVLVPAGNLVRIWNDENFIPRTFGPPAKKRARRQK
ncbi:MAG: DUF3782 domain-containing protein [candidate division KSB1 bacterium]|nr:DUF3782 domain-containing protein [candidate division KSB1 bacterium]MDZ7365239.1 DUF3782 domain-containing protein [candidate division KSB1 bacterium]MDZ7403106.1 DUF3782 domain-containing protein [candidate division KSB1 bacterium]